MKKFLILVLILSFALPSQAAFWNKKKKIPEIELQGKGYVGKLPNLNKNRQIKENKKAKPVFESQRGFDNPSELKPVPTNNPAFIDIISKQDKTSTYVKDANEIIPLLEKLADSIEEEANVQLFVTRANTLTMNLDYLKEKYDGIFVPETGDPFVKKLYATYTSYLPKDKLVVNLTDHRDNRGNFCELIRTEKYGQVSISTTKPGIERGKHYHHTKIERFMVIKGEARITFEHIVSRDKIEITVSGNKLQYVTIPVGYEHKIDNIGKDELILLMWASELFYINKPDTYEAKK